LVHPEFQPAADQKAKQNRAMNPASMRSKTRQAAIPGLGGIVALEWVAGGMVIGGWCWRVVGCDIQSVEWSLRGRLGFIEVASGCTSESHISFRISLMFFFQSRMAVVTYFTKRA
jgi:hypothetical protein